MTSPLYDRIALIEKELENAVVESRILYLKLIRTPGKTDTALADAYNVSTTKVYSLQLDLQNARKLLKETFDAQR